MRKIKGVIYCLIEGKNGDREGILLDPRYSVKYNALENIITIKRNEKYVNDFWGKPKLFSSIDEVKNMLYMTDIRAEYWGRRPLSKLTHDIEVQLEQGEIMLEEKSE